MAFSGSSEQISPELATRMRDASYKQRLGEFVPPPMNTLRLLRLTHWDFAGDACEGQLVVAARVSVQVIEVFREIYAARFPIDKLRLIDDYDGSDAASMQDNNSSGFNCRLVADSRRISRHALGLAIDINPLQNPFVLNGQAQPQAGTPYLNRSCEHPGLLRTDGAVVRAFTKAGWQWGGFWEQPTDYHHFEIA